MKTVSSNKVIRNKEDADQPEMIILTIHERDIKYELTVILMMTAKSSAIAI